MKGLQKYIKKYGNHFTTALAEEVCKSFEYSFRNPMWYGDKLERELQKRVYYNVTGTTLGDAVYLFNRSRSQGCSRSMCIKKVLSYMETYHNRQNLFSVWIASEEDVNLKPYI
jgi:hypothetical protein